VDAVIVRVEQNANLTAGFWEEGRQSGSWDKTFANYRFARHTISRKEHFLASVLRIFHRFTFHEPHR
jgi:hypothetical protein